MYGEELVRQPVKASRHSENTGRLSRRRHALLRPTDEQLQLIDLGSTNGTRSNGSPVKAGELHVLEDRDVIALSSLQLMLRIVEKVSCNTGHRYWPFG